MNIVYIYYATPGLNGLYVKGLAQAFAKSRFRLTFVVNSRCIQWDERVADVYRVFFPLTETTAFRRFAQTLGIEYIRKFIRYAELVFGLLLGAVICIWKRADVVNFSLTESFRINAYYIPLLRFCAKTVVVTVHDVVPHNGRENFVRPRVFRTADYLLVHNRWAESLLARETVEIHPRILAHPFPWARFDKVMRTRVNSRAETIARNLNWRSEALAFGFLGFIRKSKGLEDLIAGWLRVMSGRNDVQLLIAGQNEIDLAHLMGATKHAHNIVWRIGRLSNEEFLAYHHLMDVICLPYRETYAHSGAHLLSYLCAERCIIAPLHGPFAEDVQPQNGILYDQNGLEAALSDATSRGREELHRMGRDGGEYIASRRNGLTFELESLYSEVDPATRVGTGKKGFRGGRL